MVVNAAAASHPCRSPAELWKRKPGRVVFNMKSLKDLTPGQKARVIKLTGKGAIRRRIIDLGIVPGTEIEMERYAPLGDPLEVKLKGSYLSLRKEEVAGIILE